MSEGKRNHFGMPRENRVNAPLQIADAFAVNQTNLENSLLLTSRQISRNQIAQFLWFETMQIQNSIYWNFNWLIGLCFRAQNRDAANLLFVQQFNSDVDRREKTTSNLHKRMVYNFTALASCPAERLDADCRIVHFSEDEKANE